MAAHAACPEKGDRSTYLPEATSSGSGLTTRKPRWLVLKSGSMACRADGRNRRQCVAAHKCEPPFIVQRDPSRAKGVSVHSQTLPMRSWAPSRSAGNDPTGAVPA